MERFEVARLDRYFGQISDLFPAGGTCSFVVTHLLADRPSFVRAVAAVSEVRAVLPKPKSIDTGALSAVGRTFAVDRLSRELFADAEAALAYVEGRAAGQQVVLLDVGGYFASVLQSLCERFSGRIVGVVEDTENGYRRYLEADKPPCPVFSVARSPLKQPEDHSVGQSVVFSTEALMRARGDVLTACAATVIGFGKLGRSIARALHARGVRVTVFDTDPVLAVQALSQGFAVADSCASALRSAGVVLCATGNLSLRHADFSWLANGSYLASVTSSEDELELAALDGVYERTPVTDDVVRYSTVGHYFYVLADGNAVNFLHGASVGEYIFLVQAEILAALARLSAGDVEPGYHQVRDDDRRLIAETWLAHFNPAGGHR